MTLADQIDLINDLIREDPEITIREYLEALAEIDNIKPPEVMNTPKLYTEAQAQFMLTHRKLYTANELAEMLGIPVSAVYNYGSRNKIIFKSGWSTERSGTTRVSKAKIKQEALVRPEAEYSNAGFLNVTKKYAS